VGAETLNVGTVDENKKKLKLHKHQEYNQIYSILFLSHYKRSKKGKQTERTRRT
jgi:hypothetical protein